MKNDSAAPADTRMMNIVHQALRRDLDRATTALEGAPPADRQRRAIAEHLGWMMDFLRAHHESEDDSLYPVVRARRPDAAPVLDEMDRDHRRIATGIDTVEAAAAAYGRRDDPATRVHLLATIRQLAESLLPHLEREEDEAMPFVSAALTEAEWRAIEHEHNVKPKGMAQLGREGHWLIDDASPEDRAKVVGLVPAAPRFVLLHGFGRSYRRRRDACWRPNAADRRVQKHGHNEVVVAASPDAVWDVVVDIARVGEWSHECIGSSFLDGATRAEPGARFRGRNRQGIFRWGRVCEVLAAEPPELVWRTVPTSLYPDSTVWRLRVTPTNGGTRLEQSFEVVHAPKILDVVYAAIIPAHRDRAAALTDDLRRLGELARTAVTDRPVTAV
jgi:hemerythrin-like domain-containing protein